MYTNKSSKNFHSLNFLKSAFSIDNNIVSNIKLLEWVRLQNKAVYVKIDQIPFSELVKWSFDKRTGTLKHDTGRFFSIDGIRVNTNWGFVEEWEQPIINQPEIGYLGFIVKEINGILYFLVQAKIEPGNVNFVQLSPTLQATKSNYTRAHQGKAPAYLEYFINAKPHQIIVDQLQSEQGARFLKKRNRNIIIKVDDELPLLDNFIWLSLGQIKYLMNFDNLVNMDTRTVISSINFGEYNGDAIDMFYYLNQGIGATSIEGKFLKSTLSNESAINSFDEILSFITRLKSHYDLKIEKIPLHMVRNWIVDDASIYHEDRKYFEVIAARIEIENRENVSWTQPMISPSQEGICAFVCKEINGVMHFAVQAKLECGNFDIIEFAPTVQCLTGNYRTAAAMKLPFLEFVLNAKSDQILIDTLQSEEGGRFFKEQNRNMIVLGGEDLPVQLPDNFLWMTLYQIHTFIKFNNYVNIQARSLIAAIPFSKANINVTKKN